MESGVVTFSEARKDNFVHGGLYDMLFLNC